MSSLASNPVTLGSSTSNVYYQRGGSTSSNNDMSETGDVPWTSDSGCSQLFRRIASTGSVTLRPGSTTPHHRASASSIADVIETDYLRRCESHEDSHSPSRFEDDTGSSGRSDIRSKDSEPNLMTYGTFAGGVPTAEEQIDIDACHRLRAILTRSLGGSTPIQRGDRLQRLVADDELITRIAADVVRMSQNEPLGTDGCLLRINLERVGGVSGTSSAPTGSNTVGTGVGGGVETGVTGVGIGSGISAGLVAEVRCTNSGIDKGSTGSVDAATPPPTCEVILSLREDDKRWHGLRDVVSRVLCCRSLAPHPRIYISPAYKLEKIKLYSTVRSH